jgi:hypothetical protein
LRFLLGILQDIIGFANLFEFGFSTRVLVGIRMELFRKLAVSRFDRGIVSGGLNAKDLVVVFHTFVLSLTCLNVKIDARVS